MLAGIERVQNIRITRLLRVVTILEILEWIIQKIIKWVQIISNHTMTIDSLNKKISKLFLAEEYKKRIKANKTSDQTMEVVEWMLVDRVIKMLLTLWDQRYA